MEEEKEFSDRLKTCLDCIGYNEQIIKWRRQAYKERDSVWNENSQAVFFTVGSKGEGVSKYLESDHDILYVQKDTLCVERGFEDKSFSKDVKILDMDTSSCPAGYAYVKDNDCFVRSDEFLKTTGRLLQDLSIQGYTLPKATGPAQTFSIKHFHVDFVYAYRCRCPGVLRTWAERPRACSWPPATVIKEVTESESFLVAKGFGGSVFRSLEWRICFNKGENLLIQSLDETQLKLYILLKIVLKDILKPKYKEITTFMMKNIVFWMLERSDLSKECLVSRLMNAITLLKDAALENSLPYYMIENRNLFDGKMTQSQRENIIKQLTKMIDQGPSFLLGSKRLREALEKYVTAPTDLKLESDKRDDIEQLFLTWCMVIQSKNKQGLTHRDNMKVAREHPLYRDLWKSISDRVLPDRKLLKRAGNNVDYIVYQRLEKLLT